MSSESATILHRILHRPWYEKVLWPCYVVVGLVLLVGLWRPHERLRPDMVDPYLVAIGVVQAIAVPTFFFALLWGLYVLPLLAFSNVRNLRSYDDPDNLARALRVFRATVAGVLAVLGLVVIFDDRLGYGVVLLLTAFALFAFNFWFDRKLKADLVNNLPSLKMTCPSCGYDLRGSGTVRPCPECGEAPEASSAE